MAPLPIQQPTSPHWLPIRLDRVIGVFTQQFNSIAAKLAEYLPKHPFLRTFFMVKHNAINPPLPIRPLISHN